jgi:hypothetical protein
LADGACAAEPSKFARDLHLSGRFTWL